MLKLILTVFSLAISTVACLNPYAQALKSLTLTQNQAIYSKHLKDSSSSIIICTGPPGSGKTALSVLHGLSALKTKQYHQLLITRPTLLIDDDSFGALPGDIQAKLDPLLQHIGDIVGEATSGVVSSTYNLSKQNCIRLLPLQFIRGMTFNDSFIVADEIQNATPKQMKALLTRIGRNSKLVITGDLAQSDLIGRNGLRDFIDLFASSAYKLGDADIVEVKLTKDDVMRSDIVKKILEIYGE